jgi:hypothetical protein
MAAAFRTSHVPAMTFKFMHHVAFMCMHLFTAGVILCIPATSDRLSTLAHDAKTAVVRMLRVIRKVSARTPVAIQTAKILEELLKVVLQQELEVILKQGAGAVEQAAYVVDDNPLKASQPLPGDENTISGALCLEALSRAASSGRGRETKWQGIQKPGMSFTVSTSGP